MKSNIKNALIGLDMIHADLWLTREKLKSTETKSLIVKELELNCLLLLLEAAMKDLGFKQEFKK